MILGQSDVVQTRDDPVTIECLRHLVRSQLINTVVVRKYLFVIYVPAVVQCPGATFLLPDP
jgi:hypothetical protein